MNSRWSHVLGAATLARRRVPLPPPPPQLGAFTILFSLLALVAAVWYAFW